MTDISISVDGNLSGVIRASAPVTESDPLYKQVFSTSTQPGDALLPYTMPQAEYMYGCAATSIGMLLGYYDLYGYQEGTVTYNMSNLIPGTISVNSRGSDGKSIYDMSDPSLLANFIASTGYASRFYGTAKEVELPYSFVNGDSAQGLNISAWDCLADYLGTGQYWRGCGDLSTRHYNATLDWARTTSQTYTVETGFDIPVRFVDFKYGLSLYVESVGYELDATKTASRSVADFTFNDFKSEIDAGRPVLVSMNAGSDGHMVLAYGYNSDSQEIIFDDTYRADCRMAWTGTYNYSSRDFSINGVTTIVFKTDGLPVVSGGPSSAGPISGAVISGNTAVLNGEEYIDTTVVSGGCMYISSGGTALRTTVNGSGEVYVSGGGLASAVTLNSDGSMYVSDGGQVSAAEINAGGGLILYSGGTAVGAVINADGFLSVAGDCTADSTTVNASAALNVFSGGTARQVRENGGYVFVTEGAEVTFASNTFSGLELSDNSAATVHSGTTAESAVINLGWMEVFDGGRTLQTTVNSGGRMYVSSGGKALRTTVNAGGEFSVNSGGTASIAFNPWQGTVFSSAGASVTYLAADAGIYYGNGQAGLIAQYDSLEDFEITSGNSAVVFGGTATSTTVGTGGVMCLSSGGTAVKTTVNSGGRLELQGRVTLDGLQIADGAVVSAYQTPDVVLDLTKRKTADQALINDLSLIVGTSTFSITVSSTQETGTYRLAEGAAGFSGTITVSSTGADSGPLTVGSTAILGDRNFTLELASGTLTLTVGTGGPSETPRPDAPTASADITDPTNQNVTVTASFDAGSVRKEYSTDNKTWKTYTAGVVMTANGTVYFRGIDAAGNISDVTAYEVTNIDKTAPEKPSVSARPSMLTNRNVTVTASFSADSVRKEYSTDNKTWETYTAGVVMTANGTVYFRGADAAGNISDVTAYEVTNIDKVPPAKPAAAASITAPTTHNVTVTASFSADSSKKQYSTDNKTWKTYISGVVMTANGTVYFRGIDAAGNISGVTAFKVTNILGTSVLKGSGSSSAQADIAVSGKYRLTGDFGDITGSITVFNGTRKVGTGSIKEGVLNFNRGRDILLDSSLGTEVRVTVKSGFATDYRLTLKAGVMFDKGDNDSTAAPRQLGNVAAAQTLVSDGWVGFGDPADHLVFTLASAAKLGLSLTGTDATKFTVYSMATGKAVLKSSVKAGTVTPKAKLLEAGTYRLTVESSNAKKGGDSNYTAAVRGDTVFFTRGDNSDDSRETAVNKGALYAGKQITSGWVGFGDAADWTRFTLGTAAEVSLALTGSDATKFTVYSADTGKAVIKSSVKAGASAVTKAKLLEAGQYFLATESSNAKKGGNSDYTAAVASLVQAPVEEAAALMLFDDAGLSCAEDFGAGSLLTAGAANDGFGLAQGTFVSLDGKEEYQTFGALAAK